MPRDFGNSAQVVQGTSLPTYQLVGTDLVTITTSQDIFNISNPAGSTVAIIPTRLYIAIDATGPSAADVYLVRRTAPNTGGTPVPIVYNAATTALGGNVSFIPHDTNDTASQAVINAYSVNPTYGAGLVVDGAHIAIPAAALSGIPIFPWDILWSNRGSKPLLIRPGQSISPSLGAAGAVAGASLYLSFEWIEVPLSSVM